MTKAEIIDLLLEGDAESIGIAIKAMRAISPNDNIILNLAGQWNRLRKDISARIIPPDNASITENQIMNSLLEVAKKLPEGGQTGTGGTSTGGSSSGGGSGKTPTVFLSYNHKDTSSATQVKDFLRSKNINVTIDSEAMKPGEDIASFINNCIRDSDVTLSLVSPNSLLSAWVGMESINSLVGEKIANKRFIAVVIDNSFYQLSFVRESIKIIDAKLKELDEEIAYRRQDKIGIEDIQGDLTRNQELRGGLSKIVANLKNRLNVDITGENFTPGMERVAKAILT